MASPEAYRRTVESEVDSSLSAAGHLRRYRGLYASASIVSLKR
jgi:hypothetical protein